jgi:hydroxymethylpyrimidine kinase/phosphomethylpyrimidine kinase
MQAMGAKNVLIKGGHFASDTAGVRKASDYLFLGDDMHVLDAAHIDTTATHGTGCVLAAAITANLALGSDLLRSVSAAKDFVTNAIKTAPMLGRGNSPINLL